MPAQSARLKNLDRLLAGGIAWSAGAKWSSQAVSWITTLAVARILGPADYGLMGMAAVYLAFMILFAQFGVGAAIVVFRDLEEEQIAQLNTVSVLLGFAGFAVSCAMAIPIAWFFNAPALRWVIVAMSTVCLIGGFRIVPAALLQKGMRFKLLASIDACQAVGQSVAVLVFALLGFRYWALAIGGIAGAVISAAVPLAFQPHRFAWPRFHTIERPIRFGGYTLVTSLAWAGYTDADFLVAARVLGEAPLGAYTIAWNLASAPVEKIANLVTSVVPPIFSAVQTERAMLRRYLLNLTEVLAMVVFPAAVGMALVANEFVHLALGEKWTETILTLQVLAFYASFRSVVLLLPQVLTVVGEARFIMRTTLVALLIMPPAFYLGSRWGTAGIALAWVVVYPLILSMMYWRVFRTLELSPRVYLTSLRPALAGSLTMAVVVGLLKWSLPIDWPLAARFAIEVVAGMSAYSLTVFGTHRDRLRAILNVAKQLRT